MQGFFLDRDEAGRAEFRCELGSAGAVDVGFHVLDGIGEIWDWDWDLELVRIAANCCSGGLCLSEIVAVRVLPCAVRCSVV